MELALVRHAPAGIAVWRARGGRMNTASATLISIAATVVVMSQLGLTHLFPSRSATLTQQSGRHVVVAAAETLHNPTIVAPTEQLTEVVAPLANPPNKIVEVETAPVLAPAQPQPDALSAPVVAVVPIVVPIAAPALTPAPSSALPSPVAVPVSRLKPEAKLLPMAAGTLMSGVRRVVAVAASPEFARHIAAPSSKMARHGDATAVAPTSRAERRAATGTPQPIKQPLSLHTDLIAPSPPAAPPVSTPDPKRQAALQ
jgi:hypothetical protein